MQVNTPYMDGMGFVFVHLHGGLGIGILRRKLTVFGSEILAGSQRERVHLDGVTFFLFSLLFGQVIQFEPYFCKI